MKKQIKEFRLWLGNLNFFSFTWTVCQTAEDDFDDFLKSRTLNLLDIDKKHKEKKAKTKLQMEAAS